MTETRERRFWVVSPNVRDNEKTVPNWRQASLKWKAAFMGHGPDDREHDGLGHKFAHDISPNDIILIARRYRREPEVAGFGEVVGEAKKKLTGFHPREEFGESFGSLRRLFPFIPLSSSPPGLPLLEAVDQVKALHELHRERVGHKRICDWMEDKLRQKASRSEAVIRKPHQAASRVKQSIRQNDSTIKVAKLPHRRELEYEVRTRKSVLAATNKEDQLLERYRRWIRQQERELVRVRFGKFPCDAYEEKRHNLIEAKCSVSREYIRMAVGQLLDYSFQGRNKFGKPNMAVLLPERPDANVLDWLDDLRIGVIWEEKDAFLDNAKGRYS